MELPTEETYRECSNCNQMKPVQEFKRDHEPWGLENFCEVCWRAKRNWAWTIYKRCLREGFIQRGDLCHYCNEPPKTGKVFTGHHLNYNFPLFVVWVHENCHTKMHKEYRAAWETAAEAGHAGPRYFPDTSPVL